MSQRQYPPGRPVAAGKRPVTVLIGVIMAYIGSTLVLLLSLSTAFGARDGAYFGQPMDEIAIAGAPIPIGIAAGVGAVLAVVNLAVIILAVLTQRGSNGARIGLTVIGVAFIAVLAYTALTNDPISPLPPLIWITVGIVLLWVGRANTWFRQPRP